MVGVAGRSKGCVTCRQRRVKCDEVHPECNRCKKAKRVCGGYVQNNFIDGLPSSVRKAAAASARIAQRQQQHPHASSKTLDVPLRAFDMTPPVWTKLGSPGVGRIFDTESDSDDMVSERSQDFMGQDQAPFSSYEATPFGGNNRSWYGPSQEMVRFGSQKISASLNLSSFRDNIFLTYTSANILRGLRSLKAPQMSDLQTPDGVLDLDCLLSISTAYYGFQHHDQSLVQLGMQRYGEALTRLNLALAHPVHSRSAHVLSAVTTMTLYEFLAPTSSTAWIEHSFGLERLLLHRGPEAHMAGTAYEQFVSCRSSIIYACLASEKPCMIATPEWKTVPWSLDPENKPLFQRLLDILIDLPAWMKPLTRLWTAKDPTPDLFKEAFRVNKELKVKLAQLAEWWSVWREEHRHNYWEVPMNYHGVDSDSIPVLWNTVYEFRGLLLAHEYATYHAIKVLITGISRAVDSLEPDVQPAHLASMAKSARRAANEICRAMPYHLQRQHRGGGILLLLFPSRMAWKAFGNLSTPETRWLSHVISNSSEGLSGDWNGASSLVLGHYELRNGMAGIQEGYEEDYFDLDTSPDPIVKDFRLRYTRDYLPFLQEADTVQREAYKDSATYMAAMP